MKTYLITGGTSGVGKSIAKNLVRQVTCKIIIVGQNEARAQAAVKEIQQLSALTEISYLLTDLSTADGVKFLADQIKKSKLKLDGLVLSHGTLPKSAAENIALNLRSHYLLVNQLRESFKEKARVLLITGSPQAIQFAPIQDCQNSEMARAAWLLTHKTLLVKLLAKSLEPQAVAVNAFFPGDVKSNLMPWTQNLSNETVPAAGKLLLSAELDAVSGAFFDAQGRLVQLDRQKYNAERAAQILEKDLI